jgi:mono/diheme cytochrome c family protein
MALIHESPLWRHSSASIFLQNAVGSLHRMAQQSSASTPALDRKQQASSRRLLNQRNVVIGFTGVCLLAIVVFAIRTGSRPTTLYTDRPDTTNAQLVARGQHIYATRCASCHGSDLQGEQGWPQRRPNGVMPASPLDASGNAWQRDDQWLFRTIKQGGQATASSGYTSYMPGFAGLTDTDIWAVISYIKSTW